MYSKFVNKNGRITRIAESCSTFYHTESISWLLNSLKNFKQDLAYKLYSAFQKIFISSSSEFLYSQRKKISDLPAL